MSSPLEQAREACERLVEFADRFDEKAWMPGFEECVTLARKALAAEPTLQTEAPSVTKMREALRRVADLSCRCHEYPEGILCMPCESKEALAAEPPASPAVSDPATATEAMSAPSLLDIVNDHIEQCGFLQVADYATERVTDPTEIEERLAMISGSLAARFADEVEEGMFDEPEAAAPSGLPPTNQPLDLDNLAPAYHSGAGTVASITYGNGAGDALLVRSWDGTLEGAEVRRAWLVEQLQRPSPPPPSGDLAELAGILRELWADLFRDTGQDFGVLARVEGRLRAHRCNGLSEGGRDENT